MRCARWSGKKASGTVFDSVLNKITGDDKNCLVGFGVNVSWYRCSGIKPSHYRHTAGLLVFMDYPHENAGEIERGPRQLLSI